MNKKNIIINIILFLIGITIGIIFTLNIINQENNNTLIEYNKKTVFALINYNKIIPIREGDILKELNNEKIIKISDDYVTISNKETEEKEYNYKYNEYYEIWPDSQNGTIIYEEPVGNIIIKKNIEDIYQYLMDDTNINIDNYDGTDIKFNITENRMPSDNPSNNNNYGNIIIDKKYLDNNEILKIYYLVDKDKYEKFTSVNENINSNRISLHNLYVDDNLQSSVMILIKNKANNIVYKYKLTSIADIVY